MKPKLLLLIVIIVLALLSMFIPAAAIDLAIGDHADTVLRELRTPPIIYKGEGDFATYVLGYWSTINPTSTPDKTIPGGLCVILNQNHVGMINYIYLDDSHADTAVTLLRLFLRKHHLSESQLYSMGDNVFVASNGSVCIYLNLNLRYLFVQTLKENSRHAEFLRSFQKGKAIFPSTAP